MAQFRPDQLDLSRPAAAAQYLKICRDIVVNFNAPEPLAAFLEEMADRLQKDEPALAEHLQTEASRLVPAESVRHSVRRGVPPVAQVRDQVLDRLRREEDRLLAKASAPRQMGQARGCLMLVGVLVSLVAGACLWGLLWVMGVDDPWGPIAGGVLAVILFGVFVRSIERIMPLWTGQDAE